MFFNLKIILKQKKEKILDKILLLSEKGVVVLVGGGIDSLSVFSFAKKTTKIVNFLNIFSKIFW